MVDVYVTSAFSKDGSGGNKAGVVICHPELGEQDKKDLSARLGYAETAFVTRCDGADFRLEYFTPTEEVPLCGHATIATFVTLRELGLVDAGAYTIQTKGGTLAIEVCQDGLVMMQQVSPRYLELVDAGRLATVMGCAERDVAGPVQIVSTGLRDIMLPVRDVRVLEALAPNFAGLSRLSEELGVVGVHAFAREGAPVGVDAVCRNFAPHYGIDEESATGTSSCALASYLAKYEGPKSEYVFEQGYSLGLPSRILVRLCFTGADVSDVWVGGHGYLEERLLV